MRTGSTALSINCCHTRKSWKDISRIGWENWFDLDYDLLLYDVTSTYFEGEAQRNELAQRGYSRDHRPDCKQ